MCLPGLLPKCLCLQMVGERLHAGDILAVADATVFISLLQRTFSYLTFQLCFVQIVGSLCQLQQHLLIQVVALQLNLL